MGRMAANPELVAARRGVAALFVLNAATFANVVPRLPAIKLDLGLSNTALGTAIAAMPVGALLSGAAAGWLVHRFGSRRVVVACGVAGGVLLPGFALAPSWAALAAVFLGAGAIDSVMDVSMNGHALRVQRGLGRSIINGLHGMWSVGAVLGGLLGTTAAAAGVGLGIHLAVAGGAVVVTALLTRSRLLDGHDEADRRTALPEKHPHAAPARRSGRTGHRLALLGLLVVLAAVVEDAPQSWGAVLLRTELGTSAAVAGLAYLGFQACMTVSRLVGDRLVDRFGEVAVARAGGLLTAGAISVGLLVGRPVTVSLAFAVAGLGMASVFPLAFHAAGNLPGVSTGHGVAVVAWVARIGFLLAPPLVGTVGDAVNLRLGLAVVPAAGALIALLAGTVRSEPEPGRPEAPVLASPVLPSAAPVVDEE